MKDNFSVVSNLTLKVRVIQVMGSRDGAVVRALASHQCIPGSIPEPGVQYVGWVCCWFSSLLLQVFLRVLRFFPLLKNQNFQIPIRSGLLSSTLSWASGSVIAQALPVLDFQYAFFLVAALIEREWKSKLKPCIGLQTDLNLLVLTITYLINE